MTFVEHHEPGNSTRYTVTASPIPEKGFRGAGNAADYWIVTIWSRQPATYVLDSRSEIHDHYFGQKFDPAANLTLVDRKEYIVAIGNLMAQVRDYLRAEAF